MLMTAWGDGWVLMTYLQWRSLEGLARPSKNSCEIRRKNRRGVVEVEGGRRGGFAAAEALRSYGRVCLERAPPSALNRHHHNTQERAGERGREEVLSGSLQPQTRLVPEYQMWQRTRKVSCLCFVKCAMTKCWGAPPTTTTMTSSPHHTPKHTHTHIQAPHIHAGEPVWRDLLV